MLLRPNLVCGGSNIDVHRLRRRFIHIETLLTTGDSEERHMADAKPTILIVDDD